MKARTIFARSAAFALLSTLVVLIPAGASGVATGGERAQTRPVLFRGVHDAIEGPELAARETDTGRWRAVTDREVPGLTPQAVDIPVPPDTPITFDNPGHEGWTGITHLDSRLADDGDQFSLEPPDPVVCVSANRVFPMVNAAVAVYDNRSTLLGGPVSLNEFFNYPPGIDRPENVFGPFIFDPKCYRDAVTGRWYATVDVLFQDPETGALLPNTRVDIAVSATTDPMGSWYLYSLDTTHREHPDCPCFGDQPLIGADAHAFFVSVNEFPLFRAGFNGAEIYAISKSALESGTANEAAFFEPELAEIREAYSLQPAVSGQGEFDTSNGGTEYFLSALQNVDDRVAVWAATRTSAVDTNPSRLRLNHVVIDSQVYGLPPKAEQKDGPHPLGASVGEPVHFLDTGDVRFQQAELAGGFLWGNNSTIIGGEDDPRAGIAWYQLEAQAFDGAVVAQVVDQGYIAAENANLTYAAIGANAAGDAMLAFTLVGDTWFPSAAYSRLIGGDNGPIHVAREGIRPEDGFTCYAFFGDNSRGCRWGDYSEVSVNPDGDFWFATEYIHDGPRTELANWGTWIGNVDPDVPEG
jgi:hypothetical protein